MRPAIEFLSLINLTREQLGALASAVPGVVVRQHTVRPGEDPAPHIGQAEIVVAFDPDIDPARAPQLRWVQVASAGVDRLLERPLLQSGVRVTTASGIHAVPIAEHVLALMLAWQRRLPEAWGWQSRHEWPKGRAHRYDVGELHGATLGIVGYGSIGRHVGRLAHALGMRVLALARSGARADTGWVEPGTGDPVGEFPERFYGPGELAHMLGECDYVVVALPLTGETRHMIDERALAAIKPGAFLANVGRGPVVDEVALVRALQEGRLAGAGLDVFEHEPLPADSPLWGMENVILTPHVAGLSARYNERLVRLIAENLARYVDGRPLLNLVDRQRGY